MPFSADDRHFMAEALAFARIAFAEQEVPIGAIVVRDGKMIGRGGPEGRPLAPRGLHPVRHARALPHVRRSRRQRADPADRLRLR